MSQITTGTNTETPGVVDEEALQRTLRDAIFKIEAEQSLAGGKPVEVFLARSAKDRDNIISVIVDPNEWQMRGYIHNNDYDLAMQSMSEFGSSLAFYKNLHTSMTYKDWHQVSDTIRTAMAGVIPTDTGSAPLNEPNPVDLPPIVAQQRLALLEVYPSNAHLQARLELTEIVMANLYGEPLNEGLFSEESLSESASWRQALIDDSDVGSYMEDGLAIEDEIKKVRSDINYHESRGQQVPPNLIFEWRSLNQASNECQHKIDTLTLRDERRLRVEQMQEANQHTPDWLIKSLVGDQRQASMPAAAYTLNDAENILKRQADHTAISDTLRTQQELSRMHRTGQTEAITPCTLQKTDIDDRLTQRNQINDDLDDEPTGPTLG